MLEVFIDENISEYFFYKENGVWLEELKYFIVSSFCGSIFYR